MSESLKVRQHNNGKIACLELIGQIDEGANYANANFAGVKEVIFDFERVTLVNSTGLQKWIAFLSSIPESIAITFRNCTPKIVKQIDMFPGFLANKLVMIETFYAPYYCDRCDKAKNILLKTSDFMKLGKAPEVHCDDCKELMEFDAIEKKYFLFLDHLKSAS